MDKTFIDVPRELLSNQHSKVIRASPDLVSIQRYNPISISNNTLGWVWNSPSFSSLLCEKLLLSFQSIRLNINFTGSYTNPSPTAAATVAFSTVGGLSLRSYPVERLVNTIQCVLGSSSINFAQSDTAEATIYASYDNNDYVSNAGSFEYPPSEVSGHMASTIGNAAAGGAGSAANFLCAQTSSSTGSYILSGTPATAAKGPSLYIEGVYCAHPNWNGNGWNIPGGATVDFSTNPVQVQVSIAGFLKANIWSWAVKQAPQCLTNLSQMQIQMILNQPQVMLQYLEPVFFDAIAKAQTATQLRVANVAFDMNTFTTQRVLLLAKYISVPPSYTFKDTIRQYWQADRYISSANTVVAPYGLATPNAAGTAYAQYPSQGSTTISSNSVVLPCVPRYLMIFAKPARSFYNNDINSLGVQNFYLPIVNLSITMGNRTAQLTTATIEELYNLSCEASLKGKYHVFRGYGGALPAGNVITAPIFGNSATSAVYTLPPASGAVTIGNPSNVATNYEVMSGMPICLDVSTAMGLDSSLVISRNLPLNLQVTAQVINTSGMYVQNIELFILSLSQAYLSIDHMNGQSTITLGGVSQEESMAVQTEDLGSYDNTEQTVFAGGAAGGFSFGSIVDGVKKILPSVKNVAKTVASGLESMGYGFTGAAVPEGKKLAQVMKKMKAMAM
jgi:hypothetical protein